MTKTEQLTLTLFSIMANNPDYDTNAVAQYQFSTVCQELFASAKEQNFEVETKMSKRELAKKPGMMRSKSDVYINSNSGRSLFNTNSQKTNQLNKRPSKVAF